MRKWNSPRYRQLSPEPEEGLSIPLGGLDGLSMVSIDENIRTAAGQAQVRRRLRVVRLQQVGATRRRQRMGRAEQFRPEPGAMPSALPIVPERVANSSRAFPQKSNRRPSSVLQAQERSSGPSAQPQQKREHAQPAGYRRLFPEPGLRLMLPDGLLHREMGLPTAQSEHPGAATECRVQVYEVHRPMAARRLAAAEFGDADRHSDLRPFTRDKACSFGLRRFYRPCPHPFETQASTRQFYPGQRLYRLQVGTAGAKTEAESNSGPDTDRQVDRPEGAAVKPPEQPELFQYSREEVMGEMNSLLGTLPHLGNPLIDWLVVRPLRLLKTVFTVLSAAGRTRRWRRALEGRDLIQQLWGVAPPCGFTFHPGVRRWAADALLKAGCGRRVQQALLEWEIFWRRRGWR